ncbi:MAG: O-antigen ligase family protein, partial [Pseudomonadota bacterium]
ALAPKGRAQSISPFSPLWLIGLGLFSVVVLISWRQGQLETAGSELSALAAASACFLLGRRAALSAEETRWTLSMVTAVFLAFAVFSFFDFVTGPETVLGQEKVFHQNRLTGPFLSANSAATFFMMSMIWALGRLLHETKRHQGSFTHLLERIGRRSLVSLLLFIFAWVALILTGSRGGIGIASLAMITLFLWDRRQAKQQMDWRWLGLTILGGGVLLWLSSGQVAQDRLVDLETGSAGRDILWAACWQAFLVKPWFGHGLGQFSVAIAPFITQETAPLLIQQGAAHNLILQWLIQLGVVGVSLGLILWAAMIHMLRIGLRRRQRMKTYLRMMSVMMIAVGTHGMIDYALEIPALLWWFAFLLGLASSIADGRSTPKSVASPA